MEIHEGSFKSQQGFCLCKDITVLKDNLGHFKSENGTFLKFIIK